MIFNPYYRREDQIRKLEIPYIKGGNYYDKL
jgi:hypothetical protein